MVSSLNVCPLEEFINLILAFWKGAYVVTWFELIFPLWNAILSFSSCAYVEVLVHVWKFGIFTKGCNNPLNISVNFDSPKTHIPHLHNRMCESMERMQLAVTYLQEWAGRMSNMNKNSSSSLYTEDTSLHSTRKPHFHCCCKELNDLNTEIVLPYFT